MVTKFHTNHKYRPGKFRYHTGGGFTPPQLAQIYGFPAGYDGTGVKVGIVELGGGFVQSDLDAYLSALKLRPSKVNVVLVDGATNSPSDPNGADGEVMLDTCIVAAMANGASINLYFGQNTAPGFINCVKKALADGCDVISISWGAPEDASSDEVMGMEQGLKACADASVTVCCAAGDNGSGDGEPGNHVDYPGSSAYSLCCGGTSNPGPATVGGSEETVWNGGMGGGATGGGISALFSVPSWQKGANVNLPSPGDMRCVPDVAGDADPATGWLVVVDGQQMVIGGTSAVAPMWAALAAILQQATGKRQFLTPLIYPLCGPSTAMRDITSGNNGTYLARAGYDCCTGCGVPIGTGLLAALQSGVAPPAPLLEMALNGNVQAGNYLLMHWPAGLPSGFPSLTFHEALRKGSYRLTKE